MPFKDPQAKKEWGKLWRKKSIENGYGKWLYRRRAVRLADAEYFRKALTAISKSGDEKSAKRAKAALGASAKRWESIGPPPETVVGKVPSKVADDTLLEALEKLQLS